jgi:hypothetical protein
MLRRMMAAAGVMGTGGKCPVLPANRGSFGAPAKGKGRHHGDGKDE